jgi:hypothetical protein
MTDSPNLQEKKILDFIQLGVLIPFMTFLLYIAVYYKELGYFRGNNFPESLIQIELIPSLNVTIPLLLLAIAITLFGFYLIRSERLKTLTNWVSNYPFWWTLGAMVILKFIYYFISEPVALSGALAWFGVIIIFFKYVHSTSKYPSIQKSVDRIGNVLGPFFLQPALCLSLLLDTVILRESIKKIRIHYI